MPNAPRDTQKNYGPQSPKHPNAGVLERNRLAPDVPSRELFVVDPGLGEMNQGTLPSTPGVTVSPIAMPIDSKQVPGRSGPPGP